jgi:hypothetical protein
MAIESGWLAVGGPSSMRDTAVRVEDLGHVDARLCNQLSEFGHLAHLFECKYLILFVAVDC